MAEIVSAVKMTLHIGLAKGEEVTCFLVPIGADKQVLLSCLETGNGVDTLTAVIGKEQNGTWRAAAPKLTSLPTGTLEINNLPSYESAIGACMELMGSYVDTGVGG